MRGGDNGNNKSIARLQAPLVRNRKKNAEMRREEKWLLERIFCGRNSQRSAQGRTIEEGGRNPE